MSELDRCERYRAGEPVTCAEQMLVSRPPCAYCATLLAGPCPICKGRGYYLERFADNHFTPCSCPAGIGGARVVT